MKNKTILITLLIILVVINTFSIIIYLKSNSTESSVKPTPGKAIVSIPIPENATVQKDSGGGIINAIKQIFRSRSSGSDSSSDDESESSSDDDSQEIDDRPESTESVILFVEPSSISVKNNREFIISVKTKTVFNIFAVQFNLAYDKNLLDVKSVVEGSFLRQGSNTFPILDVNNQTGIIKVAITRYGTQTGVYGEGVITEITFKAKNTGTTTLEISNPQISDPQIKKVNVQSSNGKVDITNE